MYMALYHLNIKKALLIPFLSGVCQNEITSRHIWESPGEYSSVADAAIPQMVYEEPLREDFYMQERNKKILMCLSGAPSNSGMIRTAAQMAHAIGAELSAIYVETPRYARMDEDAKERLRENMSLAESLGAHIEIVCGDDIPFQIAEYVRLSGTDMVFMGQSQMTRYTLFPKPSLTDTLAKNIPDAEVHIIPDDSGKGRYRAPVGEKLSAGSILRDVAISLLVLAAATGMGALFNRLGFTNSNIIMTYLLGVLSIAILTSRQVYSLVSAVVAVFAFNYFFVQPTFTLNAYEAGYPVTFLVMFLTAFITGTLTIRLKENARQSAQLAYRTKIISDTDQMLAKVNGRDAIVAVCLKQTEKLLGRPVFVTDAAGELPDSGLDREAVEWVRANKRPAGRGQEMFPEATHIYYPLCVQDRLYGVFAATAEDGVPGLSETSVLLSILGECALALENEKNAREKEATALRMQNERLRSNLLRAISHDLRTPLTSISGNASNLLTSGEQFDRETLRSLYSDIYDDSVWLINLVENLLASTRIEEGSVQLKLTTTFADELIAESVRHVHPEEHGRTVTVCPTEELLPVRADAGLAVQVLVNLLNNALKYSPADAGIWVSAEKDHGFIRFSVSNEGSSIPDEEKPKLFEMFYVGSRNLSDGRRGLGLGLALCRSIVEAHGGTIEVLDRMPQGTVFTFTLPAEEVSFHGE